MEGNQWYSVGLYCGRKRFIHGECLEDDISSEELGDMFYGVQKLRTPIRVRIQSGSKPGDFVFTTRVAVVLISERVANLLKENNITGWDTYDVAFFGKKGPIDGYFGLTVAGRIGPFKKDRVIVKKMPPRLPGAPEYYARFGMYLDESQWDGSDICTTKGTLCRFCNEKVKSLFEEHDITNISLTRVEDLEDF